MIKNFLGLFAGFLLVTSMVSAATPYIPIEKRLTPAQLHETGLDTLSSEQLLQLNRVLAEESGASEVAAVPPVKSSASNNAAANSSLLGLNDAPIKSRLKGTVTGWQEGTVFELENGQQWKVLKGYMTLPKPMQNPEIRVVPGIVGRWFLEVHEDYPKARVYLIN